MSSGGKGGSGGQTVAYEYHLGLHFVLCTAPFDRLTEIQIDDRIAFKGDIKNGTVTVDKRNLFGGTAREGGVAGDFDVESGNVIQGQNSYLVSKLGSTVPNFRGVVSVILKQFYIGINPYLKKIKFRCSRVHTTTDDQIQWYDSKAGINESQKLFIDDSILDGEFINLLTNTVSKIIDDMEWNPSGTRLYIIYSPSGQAHQIDVTTPFDLNTGIKATQNINLRNIIVSAIGDQGTMTMYGMAWVNNGFTLHTIGTTVGLGKGLYRFDFLVAYDFYSTATYTSMVSTSANFDFSNSATELLYSFDGLLLIAHTQNTIYTTSMTTPFDVSTATGFTITDTIRDTQSLIFNDKGTVAYFGERVLSQPFKGLRGYAVPVPFDATSIKFPISPNDFDNTHLGERDMTGLFTFFVYALTDSGDNFYHCFAQSPSQLLQFKKGDGYYSGDLNPAHIIRECLTSPDFGMGLDPSNIDDVSFTAAADTLFDEGMGMSILLSDELTIKEFVQEIVRHIDATLYIERITEKYTLKLIRNDYTIGALPSFNETNIEKLEDVTRTAFGELVNSVSVTYYDIVTDENRTVTVQDIALVQEAGEVNDTSLMYIGFTNSVIASKVAQRDLNSLSIALRSIEVFTDRSASSLNVSDPIFIDWPDLNINGVYRVTEIAFGDTRSGQVRIKATEDVFAFPQNALLTSIDPEWQPTIVDAVPMVNFHITENTYYELVKKWRQTETDQELTNNPNFGQITTAGASPASSMLNAQIWIDDGGGYQQYNSMPFCPVATLTADMTKTDLTITISNVILLSVIRLGAYALIDGEFVVFDVLSATSATIRRGILDTLPATHLNGAVIYFLEDFWTASSSENVTGEMLNVKLATYSGSSSIDIATITSTSVTMSQRALRPYNAGNLKVNTFYFPVSIGLTDELQLTWAHRNRQQQTGSVHIGFTDPDVTLPTGVTYTIRIYGQTDVLIRTLTLLTTSFYTYPTAEELSDSGLVQLNTSLRFELETIENGIISREMYNHTVTRV